MYGIANNSCTHIHKSNYCYMVPLLIIINVANSFHVNAFTPSILDGTSLNVVGLQRGVARVIAWLSLNLV